MLSNYHFNNILRNSQCLITRDLILELGWQATHVVVTDYLMPIDGRLVTLAKLLINLSMNGCLSVSDFKSVVMNSPREEN